MAGGQGLALPDRCTEVLYHTSVLAGDRLGRWVHPTMGASFWVPLGSYTGMLSLLLWTTPNLGCTPADGVYPGLLARFSPYLVSYAGCGRDARDPRGICNHLGCTHAALGASRIIRPLGSPMSADEKGSTEPESTHSLPSWPSANPEHPDPDNVSQRSWDTPGVCSGFCKCARDTVAKAFGSGFCKCARDTVAKAFGAW